MNENETKGVDAIPSDLPMTPAPEGPLEFKVGTPLPPIAVLFQQGPIKEVGVNGVTHEALLAILIDRLEALQRGPYACVQNAEALKALENARDWLNARTNERTARGVEGTSEL